MQTAGAQPQGPCVLKHDRRSGALLAPDRRAVHDKLSGVEALAHGHEVTLRHLRDLARAAQTVIRILEGSGADVLWEKQAARDHRSHTRPFGTGRSGQLRDLPGPFAQGDILRTVLRQHPVREERRHVRPAAHISLCGGQSRSLIHN